MSKSMLVVGSVFLLLSCSDGREAETSDRTYSDLLQVDKKYHLKDCVAKIALLWDDDETWSNKYAILDEIQQEMRAATNDAIAKKIPLFFDSYTREASHITVYYPDKCEERVSITNMLIQNYLVAEIDNFPDYSIEIDIEPGFDGSMPSCCWLDN